jgi:hypothetical protein
MTIDRLPESTAALYAELLDQALIFERMAGLAGSLPGSVVEKELRGRRYLYWQVRKGDKTVQRYLGPATPELRADLDRLLERRADLADDRTSLDRLAAMLLAGGALREESRTAEVLRLLADLDLFRRGAVLVGTQAYRVYGNLLGVHLPTESLRTQDVDGGLELTIALASSSEPVPPVESALGGMGLLPIPGLDPREPSTSFKLRRRDLRVDFLTPAHGKVRNRPVQVPGLGLAAWPLPFLDYLLADPVPAVVVAASPVLVRVPRPGRFALHKLWTAAKRPVHEATKATKDRRQAAALLEVLARDRPDDLIEARSALDPDPAARRLIERELNDLPEA